MHKRLTDPATTVQMNRFIEATPCPAPTPRQNLNHSLLVRASPPTAETSRNPPTAGNTKEAISSAAFIDPGFHTRRFPSRNRGPVRVYLDRSGKGCQLIEGKRRPPACVEKSS